MPTGGASRLMSRRLERILSRWTQECECECECEWPASAHSPSHFNNIQQVQQLWFHFSAFLRCVSLAPANATLGGSPSVTVASTSRLRAPSSTWLCLSVIAPLAISASELQRAKRANCGGTDPETVATAPCRQSKCIVPLAEAARSLPVKPERSSWPRARGTPERRQSEHGILGGSSPRARGTRRAPGASPAGRFIPACAGNTAATYGARCLRFIPACAGNTASVTASGYSAAHPRVRGEHAGRSCRRPRGGSSPRARRTRGSVTTDGACPVHPRVRGEHDSARSHGSHRFIPACAGNTRFSTLGLGPATVHPRVRGEHSAAMDPTAADGRFIPACAGNTRLGARQVGDPGGSSPRARGTRRHAAIKPRSDRFIPACAGNTSHRPEAPN